MKTPSLESIHSYFLKPLPYRLFYYGEIKEHAIFLPYFDIQPIEYAINGKQPDPYPLHTRRQIANGRYPLLLIRYDFQFKRAETHEGAYQLIKKIQNNPIKRMYWFACITPEELLTAVTMLQVTFDGQKCTVVQSKKGDVRENYLSAKKNDWLWQLVYGIEPLSGERIDA